LQRNQGKPGLGRDRVFFKNGGGEEIDRTAERKQGQKELEKTGVISSPFGPKKEIKKIKWDGGDVF